MEFAKAKRIADRLVEIFAPHSDIINIAGSVRRKKPEVKDIELVVLPRVMGGIETAIAAVADTIVKGKPNGRYMQILLKGGVGLKLDLFMPAMADYYRQYAMRTGSADYSAKVLAGGWRRIGWCGTDKGMRKTADCIMEKGKWKCIKLDAELPPAWQSEEEFFDWIKVKWVEPEIRS
jgi:DNA polymerase/3'-5' exonuclease PolX